MIRTTSSLSRTGISPLGNAIWQRTIHRRWEVLAETQCPDCGYPWLNGALAHDCKLWQEDAQTWRDIWSAADPPSNGQE